jgi:glutathione S-transferase
VAIDRALSRLEIFLDIAEDRLSGLQYLAADRLTLADIQFGHCLFRYFDINIKRADLPNLRRYYEMLSARPPFREHVMISYDELHVKD